MAYQSTVGVEADIPPQHVLQVVGHFRAANLKPISVRRNAGNLPTVISVVRNEKSALPGFLDHYRTLGIEHFCFIDNGSDDGTVEFIASQPDATLYQITDKFCWQKKHGWIFNAILMLGRGRDTWFIYVDADEHIVFPGKLPDLLAAMKRRGISRIRGMLVDMYAKDGENAQSYFDRTGYTEAKFREIISRKGGPRQRIFFSDRSQKPEMTKYPIFQLNGNEVFANPHHIWPYAGNFNSPCYLGILHYKFTDGFADKVKRAVEEKTYWNDSAEYKRYAEVMGVANRPISFYDPDISARYNGAETLIENGLIEDWRV